MKYEVFCYSGVALYKKGFNNLRKAKIYAKANQGRVYDMRPGKGRAKIYG